MKKPRQKIRGVFEKVPGSNVWWVSFTDAAGKQHRQKAGSWTAARDLRATRWKERLDGKVYGNLRKRRTTFREIANDAVADVEKRYERPSDDVARLKLLIEWFGDRPADLLTVGEIEKRFEMEAVDRKWKAATWNHHRSVMSLAYRLALKADPPKVAGNPVRDLQHKYENNNRVRFLSTAEEKALTNVIAQRYPEHLDEFYFARLTGLRQGSMYGLTWTMVDLESGELHLPRTKNGSPLHVPLNSEAIAILEGRRTNGMGAVFISGATGKPLRGPKHWFTDAVREAHITDFRWHDLRHDYATRLRRAGVSLEDIADLLGHKSLSMSRRYAHVGKEQLRYAVDKATIGTICTNAAPEAAQAEPTAQRYVI